MAIIPVYGTEQGGNSTRIYYNSGDVTIDSRKTKTVLQSIGYYFGANLEVLQSSYGKMFNCKLSCPYAFSKNHIYIPVKVRSPFVKKDGATGYINFNAFKGLEINSPDSTDHQVKCFILLSGEHRIASHLLPQKIKERINLAQSVQERYCYLHADYSIDLINHNNKNAAREIKIKKGLYFKLVPEDEEDED